ncbi:zinc finger protein 271-like [Anopheles albimanus]|uniref:Uncharacterized protein n=1 Tax=Anopheles albimanus TaxID=7167 RepID=A0A182FNH2_ANOAL|nr:zinc finger protein 271-like [Anopheles albimanus]
MTICRGCLQKDPDVLLSFAKFIKNVSLETRFSVLTGLSVSEDCGFPGYVCQKCARGLVESYNLRNQFLQSEQFFRSTILPIQSKEDCSEKLDKQEGHSIDEEGAIDRHLFRTEAPADEDLPSGPTETLLCTKTLSIEPIFEALDARAHIPRRSLDEQISQDEEKCDVEHLDEKYLAEDSVALSDDTDKRLTHDVQEVLYENVEYLLDVMCCGCPGQVFASKDDLRNHSQEVHLKDRFTSNTVKPYECDVCYKRFSIAAKLVYHQKRMYNEAKYSCQECGSRFNSRATLLSHRKAVHIRVRAYACDICQMAFYTSSTLSSHRKGVHSGRQFKCSKCDKKCSRRSDLLLHEMTHNDERPFACDHCSKRFKTVAHLRHHQLVHTGNRPIKCKYCGAGFATYSDRRVHQLKHENIDAYPCPYCGKAFQRNYKLQVHIRKTHTFERPFGCALCDRTFTQRWELTRHCEKEHTGFEDAHHASLINIDTGTIDA